MRDPLQLITEYLNEDLTAAEMVSLSDWIGSDPDHARTFVAETFVHRRIRDLLVGDGDLPVDAEVEIGLLSETVAEIPVIGGAASTDRKMDSQFSAYRPFILKPLLFSLAAAIVVLVVAVLWPRQQGIARLHGIVDATWANGQALAAGNQLPAGEYDLLDGLAMLRYDSGVEVIVEAPARFRLDLPSQFTVTRGKAVITCPTESSHGFAVILPNAKVIDLGTEFGVSIDPDGASDTQVFDGVVEVLPVSPSGDSSITRKTVTLMKGEAGEVDAEGTLVTVVNARKVNYVRRSDFEVRQRVNEGSLAEGWLANYQELRRDPRLLFWCDMHPDPKHTALSNLANSNDCLLTAQSERQDESFVAGRWAKNLAVQMKQPNEQLDVRIPGEFQDLTLAMWVKFLPEESEAGKTPRHRGLLLSNWEAPGHVHWQRKGDDFRVTVITNNGGAGRGFERFVATTPRLTPDEWHLLVSVVDSTGKQAVSHYVDGELVDRQRIEKPLPSLSLGPCGVGGWSKVANDDRSLNGCIDDLFIWSRALSSAEVESLYRWGCQ